MRERARFLGVVLVSCVALLACGAGSSSTTSGGLGGGAGAGGSNGGAGDTCDAACAHYYECKGVANAQAQAQCTAACSGAGYSVDQLRQYVGLDCPTAIDVIDNSSGGGGGGGGGGGVDCNRCVWDGSSCIWMSPNAPVTPACDASCCPGH